MLHRRRKKKNVLNKIQMRASCLTPASVTVSLNTLYNRSSGVGGIKHTNTQSPCTIQAIISWVKTSLLFCLPCAHYKVLKIRHNTRAPRWVSRSLINSIPLPHRKSDGIREKKTVYGDHNAHFININTADDGRMLLSSGAAAFALTPKSRLISQNWMEAGFL